MSGTMQTPSYLMTNEIVDNASGLITAANMRDAVESSAGLVSTTQAANYTAALVDRGTIVEMTSASANTFTVPPNASVAFPVHALLHVCQFGAGVTTIAAGAGVTIRSATGTFAMRAQYGVASIRKRATNEWVLFGDLA